jgi:segregation and condensation protein B
LSQIDELLPEGIGEEDEKEKTTLSTITDSMAEMVGTNYSQGEDELMKITEQLEEISTSSEFFEKEKIRQREKRDQEKAQNIREALALGEQVSTRDVNWLKRYDEALAAGQSAPVVTEEEAPAVTAEAASETVAVDMENPELQKAIAEFDAETDEDDELPFLGEADELGEDEGAEV